jgi:hypothetical protein
LSSRTAAATEDRRPPSDLWVGARGGDT